MTISVVFNPPLPSDDPATFNSKAFTTLGNLNTWSTQANSLASAVNTNATNAASSASSAASSASAAAASLDAFDDRYLGSKTSDPALDNDGNALQTGALYWNTTANEMRVRTAAATWTALNATSGIPQAISVNSAGDALRITQTGSGNALVVEDSANPDSSPFVINSDGVVIAGHTGEVNAPVPSTGSQVGNYAVQVNGAGQAASISLNSWSNSVGGGAGLSLNKSRSGTVGDYTISASGDTVGFLQFTGADGAAFLRAAQIFAQVDGTPGTGSMPGRLVFSTTPSGSATPTERMRITSEGNVGIGTSSPVATLQVGNGATAELGYDAPFAWISARANSALDITTSPQELLRLSWEEGSQNLGSDEGVAINFSARLAGDTAGLFRNIAQIATRKETSSDDAISALTLSTSSDGSTGGLTERLRIDSGGDVGIGTISPAYRLDVYSDGVYCANLKRITAGGNAALRFETGDNNYGFVSLETSGNLVLSSSAGGGVVAIASSRGLSISRTAVTAPAASDGNVFSGTYTPTLYTVGTNNVSAATASSCQYMRVGNTVTVSGRVLITPAVANTYTRLDLSLPISTTLTNIGDLSGVSHVSTTTVSEIQSGGGAISAETTNSRATIAYAPTVASNRSIAFTFTYRVA